MNKLKTLLLSAFAFFSVAASGQTPVIQATGSTDVCSTCVPLFVSNPLAGFSYSWFVGSYSCTSAGGPVSYGTGPQIQACGTGEYFCVATNPNGVQYPSAPISVRVLPGSIGSAFLPKPYPTDPVTCMDTVNLCIPTAFYAAFPNTTIAWYFNGNVIPGATSSGYVATAPGNYKYSITSACTTAFSSTVDIFPVPADPVVTTNTPVPVCTQDTIIFTVANAQPNYSYTWERFFQGTSYLTIGTGSSVSYAVVSNAFDTLRVRVKQTGIGCVKYSDDYIVPLQNNNPTITPNGSQSICGGTTVALTGYPGSQNPGYTFQWYKNGIAIQGATSAVYNAGAAGSYTVATTAACGTNTSAAVTVTVLPAPSVNITAGGPTVFCNRDSVKLSSTVTGGSAPYTYQWRKYGNNILGAMSADYMAGKSGKYTLRVTDANGCGKTSNQIGVTVNPLPVANISANGPTIFCQGGSVTLTANSGTGLTYQWKRNTNFISGATGVSYTVTTAAKYRVVITNTFGCTRTSNTIDVFVPCREGENSLSDEPVFKTEVHPNPSSGSFRFSVISSEEGAATIRVFDMTGRAVEAEIIPSGDGSFEVSGLRPGVYIAEIIMGKNRETVRIIKTE